MSFITEKEETIKLVEQLKDIEVLQLVKRILVNQQSNTLNLAIEKGIDQSRNNKIVAHEDVMHFFKEKYR